MAIPQFGYIMTSGHLVDHSLGILQIKVSWKFERFHFLFWKYWVDRKVHLGFPTRCYGKTPINFLAKPIPGNGIPWQYCCCCFVTKSWLCDSTNCSMPGFPDLHCLPEFAQIHVHWVGDAIQPSHLLSSPSPPALNLSQHQGLFLWVSSSLQVAKVLELSASVLPMNIQGWFPLELTDLILLSKGLSRVFSSTTIWKRQFFGTQPFLWSKSHICTWLLEKTQLWLYGSLSAKWCLCFLICCLGLS